MNTPPHTEAPKKSNPIVGIIFTLVLLAAGLFLGAGGELELKRDAQGATTAVQSWRFANRLTLLTRSVNHVSGARMVRQEAVADEMRTADKERLGELEQRLDALTITGDTQMLWPEKGDLVAIQSFLSDKSATDVKFTPLADVRRIIGSWCCLVLFALIVVSGLWKGLLHLTASSRPPAR